ncbi:HPr family phosphocarrier protein [Streptomyces sp. NBC_00178]|uniref:HPr family phosphocarrier protein n=1 Tax=Streptomyces sp. NBC_00178 TaxID=2975672 RepID=UPI002E2A4CBF|nr:HPr family phosphocarrier protein [Streptomyces sp. NBC_00178]
MTHSPYDTKEQAIRTVERRLVVTEKAGLHARPAALFAQTAARYQAEITVARPRSSEASAVPGPEASARSMLSLMTLNIRYGDEIVLTARGEDGTEALDALAVIAAPDPS